MVIQSLQLQNYRRFAQLDLDFPETVIGIVGRNGAGKTTIIEAIGWALYGSKIVRTDKQDIRSQFADIKDICRTDLQFRSGGHHYRITRQLKGKSAILEVAMYRDSDPKPIATQEQGVGELVEKVSGLDYRSFFASVFARQRDLAALSSMRPEDRRKCINRLINIDTIDRARDRVRKDRNDKKIYVDALLTRLKDENQLQDELRAYLAQVEEKIQVIAAAAREVESSKREYQTAKEEYERLGHIRDLHMELRGNLEKIKVRLDQQRQHRQKLAAELQEIRNSEAELAQYATKLAGFAETKSALERMNAESLNYVKRESHRSELERLSVQIERDTRARAQLAASAEQVDCLVKEADSLTQELSAREGELEEVEGLAREAHASATSLRRKGEEAKERKRRVEGLGRSGPCPVCTRPLEKHYEHVIRQFEDELTSLREAYTVAQATECDLITRAAELKKKIVALRGRRDELIAARQRAQEAQRQSIEIQERLDSLRMLAAQLQKELEKIGDTGYAKETHDLVKRKFEELSALKERALRLEERVKRRDTISEDIARIETQNEQAAGEIEEMEGTLRGLNYDEEEYQGRKAKMETLAETCEASRDRLGVVREEKTAIDKDVARLKHELQEHKIQKREIAALKKEITYFDALEEHFSQFRLELAGRIRPLIAARASELLRLTTDNRYSIVDLDTDYNISIYEGTTPHPIARFSGGEQDLANLCLRIAISQVVAERTGAASINFIVLDEIFGSQDEGRRQLILNALHQLSSQFRQIFIITHIEEVKEVLSSLITVEEESVERSAARFT